MPCALSGGSATSELMNAGVAFRFVVTSDQSSRSGRERGIDQDPAADAGRPASRVSEGASRRLPAFDVRTRGVGAAFGAEAPGSLPFEVLFESADEGFFAAAVPAGAQFHSP